MNYKHAYHAGNFADVAKHILLVQLLNQMSTKGKPLLRARRLWRTRSLLIKQ